MGRGPELEQISGGDPTFRVEVYRGDVREVLDELCESRNAHEQMLAAYFADPTITRAAVVNERSGFTRDDICRPKGGAA